MTRVLYIEDNDFNRLLVRRVLEADGFEVIEAEGAQQGITLARQQPPDLILMDLSMPEVDGLTATRTLRELPGLDSVPIVALTANVMPADRETALKICDGFIAKPIDVDRFPAEVRQFLKS